MKKLLLLSILLYSAFLTAQITDPKATEVWEPEPRKVTGSLNYAPPSDALVLFDGENGKQWQQRKDSAALQWTVADGAMTVKAGTGDIITKKSFGDCQLHIEWRAPEKVVGEGQGRGNSGIFLQSRYEVQMLDSYENRTYSNGQAGAIYKQTIPLVNAMNPPGEWQAYDIIFKAPQFNADGIKIASGYVTVLHNGVLIQNHTEIQGTTEYIGFPKNTAHGKAPIILQDHNNPTSFRNIWIREL